MKQRALEKIVVAAFCVCIASCSWVTRDYVYSPNLNSGWVYKLEKGYQRSVKDAPVPDKGVHTYSTDQFDLKLWSGFTLLFTAGPWLLPVVPSSRFSRDTKLVVNGVVRAKERGLLIDMSKIIVAVESNGTSQQLEFELKGLDSEVVEPSVQNLAPNEERVFSFLFDIDAREVEGLRIEFNGFVVGSKKLAIPKLILNIEPGSFNYDEFTV